MRLIWNAIKDFLNEPIVLAVILVLTSLLIIQIGIG